MPTKIIIDRKPITHKTLRQIILGQTGFSPNRFPSSFAPKTGTSASKQGARLVAVSGNLCQSFRLLQPLFGFPTSFLFPRFASLPNVIAGECLTFRFLSPRILAAPCSALGLDHGHRFSSEGNSPGNHRVDCCHLHGMQQNEPSRPQATSQQGSSH